MALGLAVATLCMLAALFAGGHAHASSDTIQVGSKRFTESYLLGQIAADRISMATPAEHRVGLGNTAVTLAALQTGGIDCYPEYLGTIELEILKEAHATGSMNEVNAALAGMHLVALGPLGFADRYALAVTAQLAEREELHRISDLKQHGSLKIGLSQEFLGRRDGWPGLAERYALTQKPLGLDHGLAYQALAAGQVDVIDIYSTDARIEQQHLVVLDDDLNYFPNYDAVMLAREDLQTRSPKAWQALSSMTNSITQRQMIALNKSVEIDGRDFHQVADAFVSGGQTGGGGANSAPRAGLIGKLFGPDLGRLFWQHVRLVGIAVIAAVLVGVPLGVLATLGTASRTVIVSGSGILQTIPSLALLAFLIPLVGQIGTWPALIALFLYGLLPIVRNVVVGLQAVSSDLKDAAKALGLSSWQRLWLIELPLSARVILAGIKTATVLAIGTATLAALIGAGGFGERITIGLALNDNDMLLAGAIPAAALAVLAEIAFEVLDRHLGHNDRTGLR